MLAATRFVVLLATGTAYSPAEMAFAITTII